MVEIPIGSLRIPAALNEGLNGWITLSTSEFCYK